MYLKWQKSIVCRVWYILSNTFPAFLLHIFLRQLSCGLCVCSSPVIGRLISPLHPLTAVQNFIKAPLVWISGVSTLHYITTCTVYGRIWYPWLQQKYFTFATRFCIQVASVRVGNIFLVLEFALWAKTGSGVHLCYTPCFIFNFQFFWTTSYSPFQFQRYH